MNASESVIIYHQKVQRPLHAAKYWQSVCDLTTKWLLSFTSIGLSLKPNVRSNILDFNLAQIFEVHFSIRRKICKVTNQIWPSFE